MNAGFGSSEVMVRAAGPVAIGGSHAIRPDMVVIGSHGRSAVMRILLGSVSPQMARLWATNDVNSGSISVAPYGIAGYDVNPELRVRY